MKNYNCMRHVPYLRNSVAYDHDFWYTCKMIISPKRAKGIKGQKMFQDDKKNLSVLWLSCMVHLCKMMISLGFFYICFSKFWFFGLLRGKGGGVKGQKMVQNEKKFCLSRSMYISGIIHYMILIYVAYGTHV